MRVSNQPVSNSETKNTSKAANSEKVRSDVTVRNAKANAANTTDDVSTEISSRAKEMASAKKVADGTPDVREKKIAELRERIQNKQYNVKPEEIADKMIREHAETKGA